RRADAVLGAALSVERRRIEQRDAGRGRRLDGGDGRGVVQHLVDVAQRRSAEAENGDVQAGPAELACRDWHAGTPYRPSLRMVVPASVVAIDANRAKIGRAHV